MNIDNDIIPLQACHVTQHTNGHEKTDWSVEKNITDEQIYKFPKTYTEAEIFHILDFAKKFELEALNIGINLEKTRQNQVLKNIIDTQKKLIGDLANDNERLATALEKEFFKNLPEEC